MTQPAPDPIDAAVDADVDTDIAPLSPEEKATRSGSFGAIASSYERYRPGPPLVAVDWMVPTHVGTIVDLGAGTGALTRLLVDRADEVIAVEPDDRMRAVLTDEVAGVRAVKGKGEQMPLPDGSVDAVLASSSWHWMDPIPALHEIGRVLVPGGILGAVWSGPDPEGTFLSQAWSMLADRSEGDTPGGGLSNLIVNEANRPSTSLEIPPGVPFDQPEHKMFSWDVALNADELIGLLGTFSWIITMDDEMRERLFADARRLLRELMGVEGETTVDIAFGAGAWRSKRSS